MRPGMIYLLNRQELLLLVGINANNIALFAKVTYSEEAERMIGCDKDKPFFFVRKNVKNGLKEDGFVCLEKDGFVDIAIEGDGVEERLIEFGSLGDDVCIEEIKRCAMHHGWVPKNMLEFF